MDPERDRGDLVVMVKLPVELRRCPNADGLILGSVNFVFRTFHDDRVFLLDRDIAVGFAVLGLWNVDRMGLFLQLGVVWCRFYLLGVTIDRHD